MCGLRGHELIGVDARELREQDRAVARVVDGVRWHRCLRCDSWLPRAASRRDPPDPTRSAAPRGKPLRDKIVLRLIA